MKYELHEDDLNHCVATAEFEDDLLAESWAKTWVRDSANSDRYMLRRTGDGWAMSIFRTQGGQWYATPASVSQPNLSIEARRDP